MNTHAPPKKAPGELASKTGRKLLTNSVKYHALDLPQSDPRLVEEDYGARYRFLLRVLYLLNTVVKPFLAITFWIEQECARIETKRELDKWNRANRQRDDHEPLG